MFRTRLMATSLGYQESENAFSHPNRAPTSLITIQQQLQSMATAMAELTQQKQELIREVNRQRQQQRGEERDQNSKNEEAENNVEGNQSRGIVTRRVPHLEREMDQIKEPWKR